MLIAFILEKNAKGVVRIAEQFKRVISDESLKDELDVIMELAKTGKWSYISL